MESGWIGERCSLGIAFADAIAEIPDGDGVDSCKSGLGEFEGVARREIARIDLKTWGERYAGKGGGKAEEARIVSAERTPRAWELARRV